MTKDEIFAALAAPFPEKAVKWRVGSTDATGTRGRALPYIDARHVMDRLDDVVGPENWQDSYEAIQDEGGRVIGLQCHLSVRIEDEWISKSGVASTTDVESLKGAESDSLKRAAVKFKIFRYAYQFDAPWVDVKRKGNDFYLSGDPPLLPSWAVPDAERSNRSDRPQEQSRGSSPAPAPAAAAPERPPMTDYESRLLHALLDRLKNGSDPHKALTYLREKADLSDKVRAYAIAKVQAGIARRQARSSG